jgi:hypothetical protein
MNARHEEKLMKAMQAIIKLHLCQDILMLRQAVVWGPKE